jgi:hypothetical protein
LIGGFKAPLTNGPVWSSVVSQYVVSLTDPHIKTLLQAQIQLSSFKFGSLLFREEKMYWMFLNLGTKGKDSGV